MSRLANIIDVKVYQDMVPENIPEKTLFFTSGLVIQNELLNAIAAAPGMVAELPYWNDIDPADEPNYSNDNPANVATPKQVSQSAMYCRKAFLNQGWTEADLAAQLATAGTAMRRIRSRTSTYWLRRWQRRMVATSIGVMLANVANDSGDMVHDISTQDGDNATSANLISRTAVVSAAFTMGDMVDGIVAIGVHSVVMQRLVENDDIVYIPDSQGQLTIPTYLGKRVFVDDGCPVIAGTTSGVRYVTVLYGAGFFGYGEAPAQVPVEVSRVAEGGNGGGVETLWERKTWLIHPLGHKWLDDTVSGPAAPANPAGISPTDADLALAANWERKYERKNVPVAFLVTNG
jgi:hypothetical protein